MSSRAGSSRVFSLLPKRARVVGTLVYLRGVPAMLVMGVRMFLVVIVVLAIVAVGFLIATA
jgi:hypothetical protein